MPFLALCFLIVLVTLCLGLLMAVHRVGVTRQIREVHAAKAQEIFSGMQAARISSLEENFTQFVAGQPGANVEYIKMARRQFEEMYGFEGTTDNEEILA